MARNLGSVRLRKVIPVNQKQVLVIEASGAYLLDFDNPIKQWKIDCPTSCAAISEHQEILA